MVDRHTQQPGLEDGRDKEEDVDKNMRGGGAEGEIQSGDKDKNEDESKDRDGGFQVCWDMELCNSAVVSHCECRMLVASPEASGLSSSPYRIHCAYRLDFFLIT